MSPTKVLLLCDNAHNFNRIKTSGQVTEGTRHASPMSLRFGPVPVCHTAQLSGQELWREADTHHCREGGMLAMARQREWRNSQKAVAAIYTRRPPQAIHRGYICTHSCFRHYSAGRRNANAI